MFIEFNFTQEHLKELLRYQKSTGRFFWRERSVKWFKGMKHSSIPFIVMLLLVINCLISFIIWKRFNLNRIIGVVLFLNFLISAVVDITMAVIYVFKL